MTKPRTGQAPPKLTRETFRTRFMNSFIDPAFDTVREALDQAEQVAWNNYEGSRKAPLTSKAGPGFADPDYELSDEWRATRDRLLAAEAIQKKSANQIPRAADLRGGAQ